MQRWVGAAAAAAAMLCAVLTTLNVDVHPEISVIVAAGDGAEVLGGRFDQLSLADGYVWLGATAAFALVAVGAFTARLPAWVLGPAVAACALVAVLNRHVSLDEVGIEGAYFDRGGGNLEAPSLAEEVDSSIFDQFDIWDGAMWAGAGAAFALSGLALLAARCRRR